MLLSIILTTHNNVEKSLDIISDILKSKNLEKIEIVIVDNNTKNFEFKNYFLFLQNSKINFKFLFKKNSKNLTLSKIIGVKNSAGKYVIFFEPTDRIKIEEFDKTIDFIENSEDHELIVFDTFIDSVKQNITDNYLFRYCSLWNKIFSRKSFNLSNFKNINYSAIGQDLLILITFQLRAKKIHKSKLAFYNHQTLSGINFTSDLDYFLRCPESLQHLVNLNQDYKGTELYKYSIWYLYFVVYAPNLAFRFKRPNTELFNKISSLDIKKLFNKSYLTNLSVSKKISIWMLYSNLWFLFPIGFSFLKRKKKFNIEINKWKQKLK